MSKKEKVEQQQKQMSFKEAVEGTPDVSKGFKPGLKAVVSADKDAISVKDTKKVEGSVDIDKNTAQLYPGDNRWDYAIGYEGKAYFVEVHPASTTNVAEMISKRTWLLNWLKTKAPLLDSYPAGSPRLLWAATAAGVHILKTSREYRQVSQLKMVPKRPVVIG